MAGKDTNGLNGRFPGSMHFREASQQPGLLFMVVCDDPATDASVPTSSSGRVERQPYQAGQAFAILGGVPPREFLMYGTPRGRRSARRYGARNGVFVEFPDAPSDTARYAAALMGKRSGERAVLFFVVEEDGSDSLYRMNISAAGLSDLSGVRDRLNKLGLKYRLFVPEGDGVLVIAIRKTEWDPNDHVPRIVAAMVSYLDQDVIEYRGTLEYLGSDVSREKALNVFTKIIADYQRGRQPRHRRLVRERTEPDARILRSLSGPFQSAGGHR